MENLKSKNRGIKQRNATVQQIKFKVYECFVPRVKVQTVLFGFQRIVFKGWLAPRDIQRYRYFDDRS